MGKARVQEAVGMRRQTEAEDRGEAEQQELSELLLKLLQEHLSVPELLLNLYQVLCNII